METTQTTQKPLMRTIRCTYKLWADYMRSVAAECGVPDSYRVVLPFLLRHPGASQKDIAEFRNITTASVSQIVKEMQLTGYLKKEPDPDDGRYVKLYLTEKGEARARELRDRTKHADERIRELLSPEKEQEMLDLLAELSVILREKLPEEDGPEENKITKEKAGGESEIRKSEKEESLSEEGGPEENKVTKEKVGEESEIRKFEKEESLSERPDQEEVKNGKTEKEESMPEEPDREEVKKFDREESDQKKAAESSPGEENRDV